MDTQLITIYCLCDDVLRALNHSEDPQRSMSDAEVMTTALCAGRLFRGNFATARLFLHSHGYIPKRLSKGPCSVRLHRLTEHFWRLFQVLAQVFKARQGGGIYLLDSLPIPVCDNIRILRCRLYPNSRTDAAFRGYIASKRRDFYGLKVHWLVTRDGLPVEVFLRPGASSDTAELKNFTFDLPAGSTVYGDKAYNEYLTEDLLREATEITLLPLRKKKRKKNSQELARTRGGAWKPFSSTCSAPIAKPLREPVARLSACCRSRFTRSRRRVSS